MNSVKCPELSKLLYCWFIDCVQALRCRVDSNLMKMHAQALRQRFLAQGFPPTELPKLEGEAWKSWYRKWRKRNSVTFKQKVKHLKVSWAKIMVRVRLYLKNVFALRFLWQKCFGDRPMRWISWDQKPAWFNNTALDGSYGVRGHAPTVREIACHSRQRFTICTCVDSATAEDDPDPPLVGMLFKAGSEPPCQSSSFSAPDCSFLVADDHVSRTYCSGVGCWFVNSPTSCKMSLECPGHQ